MKKDFEMGDRQGMEKMEERRYLTLREAAYLLGVSPSTMYRLTTRRQIPFLKVGRSLLRFDRDQIERWMKTFEVRVIPTQENDLKAA